MSDLITEELDSMIRMSSVSDDYGTVSLNQKVCHARLVLIKEKLTQLKTRCDKLEQENERLRNEARKWGIRLTSVDEKAME